MSTRNRRTSPEERLKRYWERRCPDTVWVQGMSPVNRPGQDINLSGDTDPRELVKSICDRIASGRPLTFVEYHLAIACHLLITELPYEEFFRTRWHENRDHFAYGPAKACYACKLMRAEARKKKA